MSMSAVVSAEGCALSANCYHRAHVASPVVVPVISAHRRGFGPNAPKAELKWRKMEVSKRFDPQIYPQTTQFSEE
jgi:hypothetical protein